MEGQKDGKYKRELKRLQETVEGLREWGRSNI